MPRVGRFNIAAIADLLEQLRYAPEATLRRQMDAAEALADDVEPDRTYPRDFVVFRVTGYRPEDDDPAVMLVGEALLADLVNLVQRLSRRLELAPDEDGRRALPLPEVARRLKVSRKSLQRYRRQGLVCHYVRFGDGTKRLACYEDALRRYEARHRRELDRAAAFSRVDEVTLAGLVAEARRLRETERLSLNETALRLAATCGRAHETVRGILRRHDRRSPVPIFTEPGPLTARQVRLIGRAWRMGVATSRLARRFGKTPPTIQRAVHVFRAGQLRGLGIAWVELPTFARPDAVEVILSAPAVTRDLDARPDLDDLVAAVQRLHDAPAVDEDLEQALLGGYNLLKRRAAGAADALGRHPGAAELDAIETDLRWATLLKRRLVGLALPVAVRTVEQNLHRRLAEQPAARIRDLLALGIDVVSAAVESIDPAKGQRLERVCGHAVDRALARLGVGDASDRAAARHPAGTIGLAAPLRAVTPWQAMLELRPDQVARLGDLPETAAPIVRAHHGLDGAPPRTAAAIAETLGVTPSAAARRLRAAETRLRGLAAGR
ncbi:MAG: hypothetical protein ACYTG1_12375 [Planctomycetota bacterium]|jgi:RNA polymerase primary sigma factor